MNKGIRPFFWPYLGARCAAIAWERQRWRRLVIAAPWSIILSADGSSPRLVDRLRAA